MKVLVLVCSHAGAVAAIPGAVVRRVSDLCQRPQEISSVASAEQADRLVVTYCPDTVVADVHAQALRAGLDPLGVQVQHVPTGNVKRARTMLAASVARARAYAGSEPEHVKLRRGSLSRRSLIRGAQYEYDCAPAVVHDHCKADSGCRACLDVCPQSAIRFEDGRILHDPNICEPCGRCVIACPTGATVNPAFGETILEAHIGSLAAMAEQRPLGIAFHCRHSTAPAYWGDWHEDWFPVSVPCVGMLPPTWLIAPLLLGIARVTVLHCDGECRGNGLEDAARSLAASRAILNASGLSGDLVADVDAVMKPPGAGIGTKVEVDAPFRHDGHARVFNALAAAVGHGYRVSDPRLPLGQINNGDACTVCGSCAQVCPTGALGFTEEPSSGAVLTFDASLCAACAQCEGSCPERAAGAIALEHVVDTESLHAGRKTLRSSDAVRCRHCGNVVASRAMMDRLLGAIGADPEAPPFWAQLCQNCRGSTWG